VTLVDEAFVHRSRMKQPAEPPAAWLSASRMSARFLDRAGKALQNMEEEGPGLYTGRVLEIPVVIAHLEKLPLTIETLLLLMVYRGTREEEIAEFAVEQRDEYGLFARQAFVFHPRVMPQMMKRLKMYKTKCPETYRRRAA
jgi:hypothetical protein